MSKWGQPPCGLVVLFLDVYFHFAIYGWETLPDVALRIHKRCKPDNVIQAHNPLGQVPRETVLSPQTDLLNRAAHETRAVPSQSLSQPHPALISLVVHLKHP